MRTTLTLDEDVAAKLKAEARRAGRSFRDVVNETLRRGLVSRSAPGKRSPFRVQARDLGNLKPGLGLDNIAELLDQIEGPLHR
jgi:plasmid stability protein